MTEQANAEQQKIVKLIKYIFLFLYVVNPSTNFEYVGITCSAKLKGFAIHLIHV